MSLVAVTMPGARRDYTFSVRDTTGPATSHIAHVALRQYQGASAPERIVSVTVPDDRTQSDVAVGAGVTVVQIGTVKAYQTAPGGWTPGNEYRLKVRQIARAAGARRFRASVTNVATGNERVLLDFTRTRDAPLGLQSAASASATIPAGTCGDLFPARTAIDRPAGIRGSDGATVAVDPSPRFTSGTQCPSSLRLVSGERLVVDLGR